MLLYRVFPWVDGAAAGEPGHPLYIPPQGKHRIDNPDHYSVLYASDAAAGAVAEQFGTLSEWAPSMLRGLPALPGSAFAVVSLDLPDHVAVCDMDDPARLVELGLRPSQVVTRERAVTQAWALRVYEEGRWGGVRWWSYYDPRWASHGIWDLGAVTVAAVEVLDAAHPAVVEAAEVLGRPRPGRT